MIKLDDLFLASYGQNDEGNINDPLGLVLLWSLSLKTRPEFYCFCQVIYTFLFSKIFYVTVTCDFCLFLSIFSQFNYWWSI